MGVDVKKKAEERESIVRVSSVGGVYNRKLIAAIFQPGAFKEGLLLLYSNKERKKKKKKRGDTRPAGDPSIYDNTRRRRLQELETIILYSHPPRSYFSRARNKKRKTVVDRELQSGRWLPHIIQDFSFFLFIFELGRKIQIYNLFPNISNYITLKQNFDWRWYLGR